MQIKAKKSLGQNFLNDKNIIEKIVDSGNISQNDIAKGTTYYSKQWGWYENYLVIRNTKKMIELIKHDSLSKNEIRLIPLPK